MSEQKPSDHPSAEPEPEMVFRRLESPVRWVPPGVDFDELPDVQKAALRHMISPAYEELVEQAADSVERATGMSIVFLMWLEVLDHSELSSRKRSGEEAVDAELAAKCEAKIARHLRLVEMKFSGNKLFLRHREYQRLYGRRPRLSAFALPGPCHDGSWQLDRER